MMKNGSLLLNIAANTSTIPFTLQICNRTVNPLHLGYLSIATKTFNYTTETETPLTRTFLKAEVKLENESLILNPIYQGRRSKASARCKSRKVDLKPLGSQENSFPCEKSNHVNQDLPPHPKKRVAHQKRVSTKDSCQHDGVQIQPKSSKMLKKELANESDPSQTEVKQLKRTTKGNNISSNSSKIVKFESPPTINQKFVGAHLSIAGGLYKCIEEAVRIGARSCGLFLKSQRQWASKPLTEDTINKFKDSIQKHNFPVDKLLPHGSYLINCGSPDVKTLEKSRTALIDELQRCELLGIPLFNFHPGSTVGKISREECIDKISESINIAHSQTDHVITVIENMSCQGNTIGGKLEELKYIIDRVKDKSRIGVCIDTCHAFAAGYDVSTETGFKLFMQQLEDIVGLQYLKAVHLNDSKGKLGCHLDRHENIGKGHIGIEGFKLVMREPNFNNIPMILETPMELSDEEEIKILNSL